MKTGLIVLAVVILIVIGAIGWAVGINNQLVAQEQMVNEKWAQVQNVYQRRADLVPNLVNTVKGYAAHESQVLTEVTEARARVGQVQVNADDPASLQQFQAAQGELSSALSRLLVVSENYPTLKADQSFRDLQAQLEGTENRITVARGRYIAAVQAYNGTVRRFPTNLTAMLFKHQVKPNFTVENEAAISRPPTVDFSTAPAPAPAPAPAQ